MKKRGAAFPVNRRRIRNRAIIIVLAFVIIFTAVYFVGHALEQRGQPPVRGDLSALMQNARVITYQGEEYRYRDELTCVLFIGVDTSLDSVGTSGGYRNGGQADFLMLLILDAENKTATQFHLDRDTMAEITVLGVLGNVAGTRTAQLCLSHSFGDGKLQSSELTREAVSRLLYGIDIDFFVAVGMDKIGILNDAIGGVTLTMDQDFSALDPAMALGQTLTLTGEQAERYVRSRQNVGDGTNAARIRRQQRYLAAMLDTAAQQAEKSTSYVASVFDKVTDVLMTDMKRGRIVNEANKALQYSRNESLALPGTHQVGTDGFMQFIVEESALEQLVLDTFYAPLSPKN